MLLLDLGPFEIREDPSACHCRRNASLDCADHVQILDFIETAALQIAYQDHIHLLRDQSALHLPEAGIRKGTELLKSTCLIAQYHSQPVKKLRDHSRKAAALLCLPLKPFFLQALSESL